MTTFDLIAPARRVIPIPATAGETARQTELRSAARRAATRRANALRGMNTRAIMQARPSAKA